MEKITIELLKTVKPLVKPQTYKTIKGQIKAGDESGAVKGMKRIIEKEGLNVVL